MTPNKDEFGYHYYGAGISGVNMAADILGKNCKHKFLLKDQEDLS